MGLSGTITLTPEILVGGGPEMGKTPIPFCQAPSERTYYFVEKTAPKPKEMTYRTVSKNRVVDG